ncbi:MAG: hypothetical protein L0229_32000 [Blastocatellia bacterium]|nr:hypothetical protein [Blastocatellia bacterium]
MTNEEMERTLQFFIDQQAQFAADIQQSRELQVSYHEILSNLQNQLSRLTDATLTIVGMLGKLADIQEKTEACLLGTDAKVSQLAESHTRTDVKLLETDDRLNAFIDVVERYISERKEKGDG